MRRLVVASAILAIFLTVPLGMAAAAPNPSVAVSDSTRATAALQYLLAAQSANGSIDGSLGETADFIIGAAAAGYDPATLTGCGGGTSALSFLATKSDGGTADAAQTGKAILAVVAAGGDPASFSGRDLSARLAALYHSATGAYGDGSTFSQSFAILAVVASGGSVPATAAAELATLQGKDGSWSYGSAAPAPDDGDTNSTAIALMALDAAGITSADVAGLAYLASQQLPDGGFPYQNSSVWGPPASDPDSDSMVLQALLAAGENPIALAWSQGSNNVLTNLRASQGSDGGFIYPGSGESAFTTSQIPAALMLAPYAKAVPFTAGLSVPKTSCASSSPSPSPSSSASASPSASPSHSASPAPTPTRKPTVRPTVRPAATPTATPTETTTEASAATSTATATAAAPEPTLQVAGETAAASSAPVGPASGSSGSGNSSGGIPAPLAYALAALAGLGAVAVGGWLLLMRPVKP